MRGQATVMLVGEPHWLGAEKGFGVQVRDLSISMRKWTPLAAIVLAGAAVAWAEPPAPLTTLRAIHVLTNAQAAHAIPVEFEGTATYHSNGDIDLFVQDGDTAIYVEAPRDVVIDPGDRVLVHGKTRASFRPDIVADKVTVLRPGTLPKPVPATYLQLIRSELDCRRSTVRAQVRSANIVQYGKLQSIYMELLMDGGYIDATVFGSDQNIVKQLLDAEVEITGVVSGKFDSKSQLTGILLEVPRLSDVRILKPSNISPETRPITPMDDILKGYFVHDRTQRVRVHGTITYYQPGSAVVLQDGGKSLWVSTLYEQPLQVGDLADATGFPDARDGSLALTHAEIEDSHKMAPIEPHPVSWTELASGANAFELISVEGRVVMAVRQADRDEYVMVANGHLFSSIYHHPDQDAGVPLPPMKQIAQGSQVRITGVSMVYYGSDPFVGPVAFDVLLRGPEDIQVISGPSLLSVPNLIFTVIFLLMIVGAGGVRGWSLERKIRRQTATIATRNEVEAALERRRSRILEDINGSKPLAEIIEEILGMTSLTLKGASCWCDIADGSRLGNMPADAEDLRLLREEIPARSGSGSPLGAMMAAFDPRDPQKGDEAEALSMGAKLAALAIETRKLYCDLVRRSEFDLLTDVHNRFSLDRQMEACISLARETASNFALIYVDLDEFKQVNDHYGHRVGDLYLQEVAARMKHQLRGGDMLARLGGDEFAALMPMVGTRAQAEEIALRLERCFDEPFAVGGHMLSGSASVGIALYPEDGTTRDSLLSAADAAMYVTKHTREQIAEEMGVRPETGVGSDSDAV
jgi:diguanylate cyclase (GGDEF)-like protein